jgi:outer membrane receptor for monomeric catechols
MSIPLPHLGRAAVLALATLTGSSAIAQSAADDPILLSPFTVVTDQDFGYQATTTQAGGRINTNLKDTPGSISILTKEFMDDLGITSVQELSLWSPSAEPTNETFFSDNYSVSMRSLGASFPSRNYFRTYANGDSFNTERLEFSRGPNALLFGDANIGGINTTWTKQARFQREITQVQARVDSYGGYRTALDLNRGYGDRLALRLNALHDRTQGWRDADPFKRDDVHLAASLQLFSATQARLETQYTRYVRTAPFDPLDDDSSNWNRTFAFSGPLTANPSSATGTTRISTSDYLVWDPSQPNLGIQNWRNFGKSTGTGQSLVPGNVSRSIDGARAIVNFPGLPSREFNLTPTSVQSIFEVATITGYLDHRFNDDFFVQVAYNHEVPRKDMDDFRWDTHTIDVNQVLPNGQPNPKFGIPYEDITATNREDVNRLDEIRAMAVYRLNVGWMNQSISALVSRRYDDYRSDRYRQVRTGVEAGTGRVFSSNNGADYIRHRRYWDEPLRHPYTLAPSVGGYQVEYRKYDEFVQYNILDSAQIAAVGSYLDQRLSTVFGYRYDDFNREEVITASRNPDGTPILRRRPGSFSDTATSISAGGVFWLTRGIGISANYSESFNIPGFGGLKFDGTSVDPTQGVGKEIGLRFDLADSRLTGSIVYYDTYEEGRPVNVSTTDINFLWNSAAINRPDLVLDSTRDTQTVKGSGYEAELVYNPSREWRMRFTMGLPETEQTDSFLALADYIQANLATWQAGAAIDPALNTRITNIQNIIVNANDGRRLNNTLKLKANYFTTYRFNAGSLKGLSLGGGVNYTGRRLVGNVTGQPFNYVYSDDVLLLSALAKYELRWLRDSRVTLQLNIDNLLDNDDVDYRGLRTIAGVQYFDRYVYLNPRKFTLSATINF